MPFASYTYLTDADALAIKAYLFSLDPISAPAIPNTFAFPFNQRWAMGIWAMMFNADRRFEPHADRSAEWNRGAYLVEALAHCGECHTPRNLFQALDERRNSRRRHRRLARVQHHRRSDERGRRLDR